MKKIITILIILILGCSSYVSSQEVSLSQVGTTHYGINDINVNLSNFTASNSVGSITLKIGFDPNVFAYSDVTSTSSFNGFNANVVGNEIIIAWSNPSAVSVPIGTTTAFILHLSYIDGSCDFTFNEGCEIGNGSGTIITTTFSGLHINQATGTIPTATIATAHGVWTNGINDNELAIDFSNFSSNVGSFTFNISYDTSKLVFLDIITSSNLSGAVANASNGVIHVTWASAADISSVDICNPLITSLKLKFNYLGGASDVKFVGVNSFSNNIGIDIPSHFASNGGITLSNCSCEKNLSIDYDAQAILGGTTYVLIGFDDTPNNIGAVTLHIAYDNTALNFLGTDLPNMVASANNGIIDLAWSRVGLAAFSGFNLLFSYIGGSSDLNFVGLNQIADISGTVIPTFFNDGNVIAPSVINVTVKIEDVPLPIAAPYTVNVPITFKGSITGNDVGLIHAATIYIDYDITKLDFIGIVNAPVGVIANEDPITRTIIISWSNVLTALPLVSSKFLDLKFAKGWWGGSSTHAHVDFTSFNSVSSSLANASGGTLLANWNPGTVSMLLPNYSASFNSAQFSGVNTISQTENTSINVYPNPCSNNTEIDYSLIESGKVQLSVYNSLGQKVVVLVDESKDVGSYKFNYNTSDLAVGVYSCEIKVNGLTANYRKIIKLVKTN